MKLTRLPSFAAGLAILAAALMTSTPVPAAAPQDWTNWRGPHFDGSSDETGLPVAFSPTEGVKWSVELPGPSAGTPIVSGDSVFVSSIDQGNESLLAICLDRKTGQVKWKQNPGSGYRPAGIGTPIAKDSMSNYASPSPVTDGKRVVFFYGNGDLVAYDFAGTKLWQRNLQQDYGDFCFGWTFSSSPQFFEGKLYCQILQRDQPVDGRGKAGAESFLFALDPATGKELWRVARPTPAKMESREAFTTPIPVVHNGRKEIVLAGGSILTGHDASTGKELWRWGTFDPGNNHPALRLVPSATAGGGVILLCGPKRLPVFAVKAGMSGDISETGLAWKSADRSPVTTDVPTPLFYKGKFIIASDQRKAISSVEPADGRVVWTTELPGTSAVWASPTGADGEIYAMNLRGLVYVIDAETGKILAENPMANGEDQIRSSVAVARGNLFIRTNSRLYCVGK